MRDLAKNLLLMLALATVGVALAKTVERTFSFDISIMNDTVKAGSPVVIKVQLQNTSKRDIPRMALGGGDVHGEVVGFPPIVRDSRGKEPPLTKWGRLVFGRQIPEDHSPGLVLNAVGPVPMHPGEILKTEIRLNELYELSPGKYTVQVRHYDEDNKEWVESKTITLTVVP